MINELLWVAGAKQQHDIQKASGLAGIVGILTALFIAYKWQDWFYPLFKAIGAVNIAHKFGLVHDGYPAMTFIYVTLFICTCILFVGILAIVFVFGGILLMLFGQTEVGKLVLGTFFMLLFLPFMLPEFIKAYKEHKNILEEEKADGFIRPMPLHQAVKKNKELKELVNQHSSEFENVQMFRLFEEQTKKEGFPFDMWHSQKDYRYEKMEKASNYLNRVVASIENDQDWLIGFRKDDHKASDNKFFVFFPNPLPRFASQYFLDDCYENGSVIQSMNYHTAPKGDTLYNFNMSVIRYLIPHDSKPPMLYVPAIEIEFVWDGYAFAPQLVEGAEIQSITMDYSSVYQVKSPRLEMFFGELNKKEMVQNAIKEAHIAMYLMPIAYTNDYDNDRVDYIGDYKKFMENVPNADTFAPLYAADVQERIIAYANMKKEWAINWIAKDL